MIIRIINNINNIKRKVKTMEIETLQLAADKKFTDFENAVKLELQNKLSNHDYMKKYASAYDNINRMKDLFNQITKSKD